jgi:tetratricopeptide (TPR) repeat protein
MTDWEIVELDRRGAPKGSLPLEIVVPAGGEALAEGGLTRAQAARWAAAFLADNPEAPIAPGLRQLVAKDRVWLEAEPFLLAEDWEAALPLLEQIIEIDPSDLAAYFNLASSHRGLGEAEKALAVLGAIEDGFGDEGVYHANVGRTLELLDRREDAIAAYERALELLPGDGFCLDRLVALGHLVQVTDENGQPLFLAREVFDDSVRTDLAQHTDDPEYLIGVAEALLDGHHDDLARNAAELALAVAPGRSEATLYAGIALARLGRFEEALVHLDDHVRVEPTSAGGHGNRGMVLRALGRVDEAIVAGRRALELNPNDIGAVQIVVAGDDGPGAALRRTEALAATVPDSWAIERIAGDLALAAGDLDEALVRWGRAVALGADDSTLGMMLGELGRVGRIDELCAVADGIMRLSERDPGVQWNVANGYAEAGRTAEARIVFAQIAHAETVEPGLRAAAEARAAELGT